MIMMKRLIKTISGREICVQKWDSIALSSDSDTDYYGQHSVSIESTETAAPSDLEITPTIENQFSKGTNSALGGEYMYEAALVGNWQAAEKLLKQYPELATEYLTKENDLALHVATAMENKEFVRNLVKRLTEEKLALHDGRGYTAFCYAVLSDEEEIAGVMIKENPNFATVRDRDNVTPLYKAALRGNKKMVSYLLESSNAEFNLSNQEWFDLLLVTIRRHIFGVAMKLVEKNKCLAMMVNEKKTALHILAQQEISNVSTSAFILLNVMFGLDSDDFMEKKPLDFVQLAEKLWVEMLKSDRTGLLELIKESGILHDAAKMGHVEIVTMLIRSYPQLIWDTDSNRYTIFHTAVLYRQRHVFNLIPIANGMIDSRAISEDGDGNNILHLAAKLKPPTGTKLAPVMLMQRELAWFKVVTGDRYIYHGKFLSILSEIGQRSIGLATEAIVPPCCLEMRNKAELTPRDLFSKEHRMLLRRSEAWMMNTADSYMLIGTILLTVVFAAAFAVPGGYDGKTGRPILAEVKPFKSFLTYELYGLLGSVFSIIVFRSIMDSNFSEDDFLVILPLKMFFGFEALLISLLAAISAFMSLFLCNGRLNGRERFLFGVVYGACFLWFFREIGMVLHYWIKTPSKPNRSSSRTRRHTLFNYPAN